MHGQFRDVSIKKQNYTVTAITRDTEVLIFEADELAKMLKTETRSCLEIIRSYRLKQPAGKDRKPAFEDIYQKFFTKENQEAVKNENNLEELKNLGLPSKSLRSILITGKETDRRHEFEQIVEDFPKIND